MGMKTSFITKDQIKKAFEPGNMYKEMKGKMTDLRNSHYYRGWHPMLTNQELMRNIDLYLVDKKTHEMTKLGHLVNASLLSSYDAFVKDRKEYRFLVDEDPIFGEMSIYPIVKAAFNDRGTILFFLDGSKSVVVAMEWLNPRYDDRALAMKYAVLKYLFDGNKYRKEIERFFNDVEKFDGKWDIGLEEAYITDMIRRIEPRYLDQIDSIMAKGGRKLANSHLDVNMTVKVDDWEKVWLNG